MKTQIVYRKRRAKPEHAIQCQIINALRLRKDILVFSIPNGGSRNAIEGANLKREGTLADVADLVILLKGGKAIFLEVKAGKNKQEASQIEFEESVKKFGFEYFVVRSLEEVEKILFSHNANKNEVKNEFYKRES